MFIKSIFGQICCCSVTKSCPAPWPHGLQHTRLPSVLLLFSGVRLFVTPRTAACQAPLSFTISLSLLQFLLQGDLPNLGIKSTSPASLLHCRQILYYWATREGQESLLRQVCSHKIIGGPLTYHIRIHVRIKEWISSVRFSRSVVSNSLQPHYPQERAAF